MFRNYLITAWRNILKSRTFTIINVLGLALGMAVCLLVLQYVGFQFSFDSFHSKADRIYRMGSYYRSDAGEMIFCRSGPGFIQLKYDFPEVEEIVRFIHIEEEVLTYVTATGEKIKQKENTIFYADSTLFKVFNFQLLQGNPDKVLREKNRMLITERAAEKWFGDEDPIGKTLTIHNHGDFVIEGVVQDLPSNSHIQFDYLLSFISYAYTPDKWLYYSDVPFDQHMGYWGTYNYFLFREDIDPEGFIQKIDQHFNDYYAALIKKFQYKWSGSFYMQPLRKIQTTAGLQQDFAPRQGADKLYALALVGVLILLMAWINYINLATVRSVDRSKEVGIRKAAGAARKQLIIQFLSETMLLTAGAFLLSIFIVVLCHDHFSAITGWQEASALWQKPSFWIILLLAYLLISLLSGLYPAFVLTTFRPVKALKGGYQSAIGGKGLPKIMSVVQYAASITLLSGTIIIYSQIHYLQNQELGFDMDQVFVVKVPQDGEKGNESTHEAFRQRVLAIPTVSEFTYTSRVPGMVFGSGARLHREEEPESSISSDAFGGVDYNFLDFYNIKLKAGRFFHPDNPADKKAYVLSERVLKKLGYASTEDALGKYVAMDIAFHTSLTSEEEGKGQIIGIIEDINFIAPNYRGYLGNSNGANGTSLTLGNHLDPTFIARYYSLKVDMSNWSQTDAQINAAFQEVYPDELYEYFFQDEFYDRQYQADIQFLNIFFFFAIQAIFIACLGLFGLAAFQVQKRSKEIGIRKVLGANIPDIWLLLAKDLLKALLIASVIGIPLINYFMKSWLEEFVYKIPLSWWMFALPVALMIFIALLTVSQHLRKAARLNPVKLLRYE